MVILVQSAELFKPETITANSKHDFQIIKSDNLYIGGYASIEIIDKQNDLITLEALNEAVKKFMKELKYRNVMTNHSNVQVGEVVKDYRDNNGRLWKTAVDDVGFFVVIKLRDDIEKAKEVAREIRKGTLRSFSIGGQALEKRKKSNEELGQYNEISKLELHEVTICEKGINPEAKFDILKQDVGNMDLTNALTELNTLLKEIKGEEIEKAFGPVYRKIKSHELGRGAKIHPDDISELQDELQQMTEKFPDDTSLIDDYQDLISRFKPDPRQLPVGEQIAVGKPHEGLTAAEEATGPPGLKPDWRENLTGDSSREMSTEEVEAEEAEEAADKLRRDREDPINPFKKTDNSKIKKGDNMSNIEKENEYLDTSEESEYEEPELGEESLDEGTFELTDTEDEDEERKSKPDLPTGQVEAGEAGEEIVVGGKPRNKHDQISVVGKSVWNNETVGLDLSPENLEKAYQEFRAEQMEKLAYGDIKDSFESRFQNELVTKTDAIAKENYDPRVEVNQLKKQFGELLDTLNSDDGIIRKAAKAPEFDPNLRIPTSEEIAKMDWSEVHLAIQKFEEAGL